MITEMTTWVAMVELPIFVTLFRMMSKGRKEMDNDLMVAKNNQENNLASLRAALADFKLHVAQNYVSVNYLKDVETRLTNHLLRIEKKLDEVGKSK